MAWGLGCFLSLACLPRLVPPMLYTTTLQHQGLHAWSPLGLARSLVEAMAGGCVFGKAL